MISYRGTMLIALALLVSVFLSGCAKQYVGMKVTSDLEKIVVPLKYNPQKTTIRLVHFTFDTELVRKGNEYIMTGFANPTADMSIFRNIERGRFLVLIIRDDEVVDTVDIGFNSQNLYRPIPLKATFTMDEPMQAFTILYDLYVRE